MSHPGLSRCCVVRSDGGSVAGTGQLPEIELEDIAGPQPVDVPVMVYSLQPKQGGVSLVLLDVAAERTTSGNLNLRIQVINAHGEIVLDKQMVTGVVDPAGGPVNINGSWAINAPLTRGTVLVYLSGTALFDVRNIQAFDADTDEFRMYGTDTFAPNTWVTIEDVQGVTGLQNTPVKVVSSGPGWFVIDTAALSGTYTSGGIARPSNVLGASLDGTGAVLSVTTTAPHGLLVGSTVSVRALYLSGGITVSDNYTVAATPSPTVFVVALGAALSPTATYVSHSGFWSTTGEVLIATPKSRWEFETLTSSVVRL